YSFYPKKLYNLFPEYLILENNTFFFVF
ncbi:uncharacterized protein METZ01_LOCUS389568, partial [marine metagenome]